MLKGIQVKLYPKPAQLVSIRQHADVSRWVYNECVARGKESYEKSNLSLSKYKLIKTITELKNGSEDHKWLRDVHSQTLQQAVLRYDVAMSNFFRRIKQGGIPGYPKFKSMYNSAHSFKYPQGTKLNESQNQLYLPKIGWVRIRGGQQLTNDMTIRSTTVVYHVSGLVTATILVDDKNHASPNTGTDTIGLDVGVCKFVTDSNGGKIPSLNYEDKLSLIANLNRKLSRAAKGSNNHDKIKRKLAKTYRQLANRRKDYCHKVANMYIGYRVVYVEDLKITDMVNSTTGTLDNPNYRSKQKTRLNASITRQGWRMLFDILEYKLIERKSLLVKVNPMFTSQTCNVCGKTDKRSRRGERFCCVYCGHRDDADVNAAKNIKVRGESMIELVAA